jgi:hypothetical protein
MATTPIWVVITENHGDVEVTLYSTQEQAQALVEWIVARAQGPLPTDPEERAAAVEAYWEVADGWYQIEARVVDDPADLHTDEPTALPPSEGTAPAGEAPAASEQAVVPHEQGRETTEGSERT